MCLGLYRLGSISPSSCARDGSLLCEQIVSLQKDPLTESHSSFLVDFSLMHSTRSKSRVDVPGNVIPNPQNALVGSCYGWLQTTYLSSWIPPNF